MKSLEKTVHIWKVTADTKRATLALTVTASDKTLTPMLIFKGKPTGHIAKCNKKTLPKDLNYALQDNAWMDEECMIQWVDKVLEPHVSQAAAGVIPILFLIPIDAT